MSALRSFFAYAAVAPVSPSVMIDPTGSTGAANKITLAFPCTLVNFDGNVAAAGYLQFFDGAVAPTAGDVPRKSFTISGAGPLPSIFQTLLPINFRSGFFVAMSSTETTYTAVATAFDVFGEVEDFQGEPAILAATIAGNLTSDVNGARIIWADTTTSSNTKKLLRVDVLDLTVLGSTYYVMLFAYNPADGATPIMQWKFVTSDTTGLTKSLHFGKSGITVASLSSARVMRDGCTIRVSDTTGTLHQTGDDFAIRAYYK